MRDGERRARNLCRLFARDREHIQPAVGVTDSVDVIVIVPGDLIDRGTGQQLRGRSGLFRRIKVENLQTTGSTNRELLTRWCLGPAFRRSRGINLRSSTSTIGTTLVASVAACPWQWQF